MIPIMRPKLPAFDKIEPYLIRIDTSRWYSNFGPLNEEYEDRLSKLFNCHVTTCASATSGLTAALMATVQEPAVRIAMPSWTFAATANAILASGNYPLMCDVDHNNIIGDPPENVDYKGLVAVAPFGKKLDLLHLDFFSDTLGIPFVIDAASGFDSFQQVEIGESPVVISTHCTKVFGTGEGGFVLSKNKTTIDTIRRITNQGMLADKTVVEAGINGKLSEYHAAIGLAELDSWLEKKERWLDVQNWYGDDKTYVSSTHSVLLDRPAAPVVNILKQKGIEARVSWYGTCHKQHPFISQITPPRLNRTDYLAEHTLFLPKYVDMTEEEVATVQRALRESVWQ